DRRDLGVQALALFAANRFAGVGFAYCRFLLRCRRRHGDEFYAVCIGVAQDYLAKFAFWVIGHQRQLETVADIHCFIGCNPGSARRDVQDDALSLRRALVERKPGRLLVKLPSWFALYSHPRLNNAHDIIRRSTSTSLR